MQLQGRNKEKNNPTHKLQIYKEQLFCTSVTPLILIASYPDSFATGAHSLFFFIVDLPQRRLSYYAFSSMNILNGNFK